MLSASDGGGDDRVDQVSQQRQHRAGTEREHVSAKHQRHHVQWAKTHRMTTRTPTAAGRRPPVKSQGQATKPNIAPNSIEIITGITNPTTIRLKWAVPRLKWAVPR